MHPANASAHCLETTFAGSGCDSRVCLGQKRHAWHLHELQWLSACRAKHQLSHRLDTAPPQDRSPWAIGRGRPMRLSPYMRCRARQHGAGTPVTSPSQKLVLLLASGYSYAVTGGVLDLLLPWYSIGARLDDGSTALPQRALQGRRYCKPRT